MNAADRHPYVAVGIIVSVVGIVMAALMTIAITVIGGMFSMYGTMRAMQTQQETIIKQQADYANDIKVLRTYEASVLSRQNFIAGLMSPTEQKRLGEFDRANPIINQPADRKE